MMHRPLRFAVVKQLQCKGLVVDMCGEWKVDFEWMATVWARRQGHQGHTKGTLLILAFGYSHMCLRVLAILLKPFWPLCILFARPYVRTYTVYMHAWWPAGQGPFSLCCAVYCGDVTTVLLLLFLLLDRPPPLPKTTPGSCAGNQSVCTWVSKARCFQIR